MKSNQLASLCLIVGALFGASVGFWVRGWSESALAVGNAPVPKLSGATPEDSPVDVQPSLAPVRSVARGADYAADLTTQAHAITQRVAGSQKAESADTPLWIGEITGWVLDDAGEPIPGATISSLNAARTADRSLHLRPTEEVGRAFREPKGFAESVAEMEEVVAGWLEREIPDITHLRKAESDAEGRFRLTGLRDGTHILSAGAEGYIFQPEMAEAGGSVQFTGHPVHLLELDVRLPDGSQPGEAAVAITVKRRPTLFAWSPESPTLRVRDAIFQYQAYAGSLEKLGYSDAIGTLESDPQSINLDSEPAGVKIVQLRPARWLGVQITDTSTVRPRLPAWAKVLPEAGGALDWSSPNARRMVQRDLGDFVAKDLEEADYVVGVGRGDAPEPEVVRRVRMGPGPETLKVSLGEHDLSQALIVHCVGPSGRPAKGVQFRYRETRFIDGEATAGGAGTVDSRPWQGGSYWIHGSSLFKKRARYKDSRYTLVAKSDALGQAEASVDEGVREITMSLAAPCTLTVKLTGIGDRDYVVRLSSAVDGSVDKSDPGYEWRRFVEDPRKPIRQDGTVLFRGLQPGDYEILLELDGAAMEGLRHRLAQVRVRATSEQVTVAVPPMHVLEVAAPGAAKGMRMTLQQDGSSKDDFYLSRRAFLGNEDRCTFKNVPAGTYLLWSSSHPGCDMTVTVPTGEVTFEVK